jgi:transcription elongation factor Elf1
MMEEDTMPTLRVNRPAQHGTAADTFAAIIACGYLRRWSKREILAAIAKKQADTKASCAKCGHLWAVEVFNRAAVRQLNVVARRGSLLRLRLRVQRHLDQLRLTCPNCGATNSAATESPPAVRLSNDDSAA